MVDKVDLILKHTEPGGHLQWDDVDSTSMRAIPPNDFANEIYEDLMKYFTLLGLDLKLPYTIESLCKKFGLKDVQTVVMDSLESPVIVPKTRAIAWWLDCIDVLVPIYMSVIKGLTKEEALVKRDEVIESLKEVYAGGVTPGVTVVRVVATK